MSANRYKEGDKVRIREDLAKGQYYDDGFAVVMQMERMAGEVATIAKVVHGKHSWFYEVEGSSFHWSDGMFKPVDDDPVSHPSHYTSGSIECADALDAMVSAFKDPVAAALSWQVGKYVWRHPLKEKPVQDLKKARWYLDRLIKHEEEKE